LPQEIRDDLNFIFVENVLEVFKQALRETVKPADKSKNGKPKAISKAVR
jgi:hypothetical protein